MPVTMSLLERQAQHLRDLENASDGEESGEEEGEEEDEEEDDTLPMPEACDPKELDDMYTKGTFLS